MAIKDLKGLKLRSYQQKIVNEAASKNVIVFLPTGAGKTLIAAQLIQQKSWQTRSKLVAGGKRTIFLVHRKSLSFQQGKVIGATTGLDVGVYAGEKKIYHWSRQDWMREIDGLNVLVVTADIMKIILEKSILRLNQINLIIFDECHHAIGNSPYCQIMRKFDAVQVADQPYVLGLSATLLNKNIMSGNVKNSVKSLESIFRATVVSTGDLKDVLQYCARPETVVRPFSPVFEGNIFNTLSCIIEDTIKTINIMMFTSDGCYVNDGPPGATLERRHNTKKRVRNIFKEILFILQDVGLIGCTIACIYFCTQLNRMLLICDATEKKNFNYAINVCCSKIYYQIMQNISTKPPKECFSDKVFQLVSVLIEYNEIIEFNGNITKCLIFVERKSTIVVLYHVLKKLKKQFHKLDFMNHSFISGSEVNSVSDTQDKAMDDEAVLDQFRNNNINVLLTTNIIDEGLDVKECNLVVRYDEAPDYRSFVQSKGRARQKESYFVILSEDLPKTENDINKHTDIEEELNDLLVGKAKYRDLCPLRIQDPVIPDLQSKVIEGVHISAGSAIGALSQYCSSLPHDKYTNVSPLWWYQYCRGKDEGKILYIIQMPTVSNLFEYIKGHPMPNKPLAKQSAAMEVCKKLYEIGELDENLNPLKYDNISNFPEAAMLFPHWKEEEEKFRESQNSRQIYEKKHAECLYECRPAAHQNTYMHILQFTSVEPPPPDNHVRQTIHSLYLSSDTYALITSKPLPEIYDFPLYTTSGNLKCSLKVNSQTMTLNAEEISSIERFHFNIFYNVVPIAKTMSFLVVDRDNKENSYMIAPVSLQQHGYIVNWKLIEAANSSKCSFISGQTAGENTVVLPTHRALKIKPIYIVTRVCKDMSPLSPFPHQHYPDFASYYQRKFKKVIKDIHQPLLEVKQITKKINYLKPRFKKGQMKLKEEQHAEFLIPELCEVNFVPSMYWVKALMLPSILHRIQMALTVNEFRLKLKKETHLGHQPITKKWKPLTMKDGKEKVKIVVLRDSPPAAPISANLEKKLKLVNNSDKHYIKINGNSVPSQSKVQEINIKMEPINEEEHKLKMLSKTPMILPELREFVEVFTSKSSNDIINYERNETLGDSFLKFSTSFYLFVIYNQKNEGLLSDIKTRIIGNRNLLYCGQSHSIPSIMKVHDFLSYSDWIPPLLVPPRIFQRAIVKNKKNANVLLKIKFCYEEQIGEKSYAIADSLRTVNKAKKTKCDSGMENFVGLKTIRDKTVADCVEALIGLYFANCGIYAGFKILKWFGILNGPKADSTYLFNKKSHSPYCINKDILDIYLKNIDVDSIERILNYKFHDRGYLLQALTHRSYMTNRLTKSYERLEFLGDAIIDLLVTVHIYENYKSFDPGQISDLRSALVNNVIFSCWVARYGLHRYLLHSSPTLNTSIMRFVNYQNDVGNVVTDATYTLTDEEDYQIAEGLEVPKPLGDLFESLAGAIFLDSGCCLSTVWKTFYNLMKYEIKLYTTSLPISGLRLLTESYKGKPRWYKSKVRNTNTYHCICEIKINGVLKCFSGFSTNQKMAKLSAARLALKALDARSPAVDKSK